MQVPLQVASEIELIKRARAGFWGHRRFEHVVGIGHSLSSTILNGVVSTSPLSLDAAVFTGVSTPPLPSSLPYENWSTRT